MEIARRAIEAANRGQPDFETINDLFHPDHQFISRVDAIEGRTHHGARGYRDWLLNTEEAVEWESRLESVRALDDDRVLAITPMRVRGKSSGVMLSDERLGVIMTLRDGKIIRTEVYRSPGEALEAVGLAE